MKVNHLKNFETLLMNMSLLILRGWKRLKFGCIDQAAMSPVHGSLAKDVLGARIPKSTGWTMLAAIAQGHQYQGLREVTPVPRNLAMIKRATVISAR
jgi:hypothetical protein